MGRRGATLRVFKQLANISSHSCSLPLQRRIADFCSERSGRASVAALDIAPFTVGFAAETQSVIEYARGKLEKKKLDMIVANRVGRDCGFDRDDNAATVLWKGGSRSFPTTSKTELA